jgi:dihydrofolate reductase
MITLIAAAGINNELGKDNDLVWHLPIDFKRFKDSLLIIILSWEERHLNPSQNHFQTEFTS